MSKKMTHTGQVILKHAGSQIKSSLFECDGTVEAVYERYPETRDWTVSDWYGEDEEGVNRVMIYNDHLLEEGELGFGIQLSVKKKDSV